MKWSLNPCRHQRRDLCLLASGLLTEPDKVRIESHLATCAECRSYFNQIKTMTAPLAGWEKHFAHIEAGPAVRMQLAKAITSTNESAFPRPSLPGIVLLACWQQLIRPSRRIWAGLATVWLLILTANLSMRNHSTADAGKAVPMPAMLSSFPQQERLLTELIGPNEPRAALPSKPFSPQPSSERRFESLMT